jgi:tetratricopeptide (TPR) repeat protein
LSRAFIVRQGEGIRRILSLAPGEVRACGFFGLLLLLVATLTTCVKRPDLQTRSAAEWEEMAAAAESQKIAESPQVAALLQKSLSNNDPMWPVDTFLRGDLYRLRKNTREARRAYRSLAEWGSNHPYKDGLGGSGLAPVALWRWIEIAESDQPVDKEEVSRLLDCRRKLQATPLAMGMFSAPLLETLPQVQEETVRGLTRLAWLAGKKNEAELLFLQYLQLARTKERTDVEDQVWQSLVKSGQASEDRLTLLVAVRLNSLGQSETAASMLREVLNSNDPDVRARASYELARLERLHGLPEPRLVSLLSQALDDASDPRLSQQILLARAAAYNLPAQGDLYVRDLRQLVTDYPNGSMADIALYQIARYYQSTGDTDGALKYFTLLQNMEANRNRFELSYYEAALALYIRGGASDTAGAAELLKKLLKERPNAELRPAALFWLGRIAEESGDTNRSRNYFNELVGEGPYDYYGVRARMHLNVGADARLALLPDQKTRAKLTEAYPAKFSDATFPAESSPYAIRLREALESGLYRESLKADQRLRLIPPLKRLEELSPEELDRSGLFSRISLLLAFRLDAQAASDLHPDKRLLIASAVGQGANDWPEAIWLCSKITGPESSGGGINRTRFTLVHPTRTCLLRSFAMQGRPTKCCQSCCME